MTFDELYGKVSEYVHSEDPSMARVALAAIVATRLRLGDPVWLLIVGPSSSGKSQVLRPLALTDKKFIHRVDDLTENTLLSGSRVKKGEKEPSLLMRIGPAGIIVISDLTVIFSKSAEARASILAQLRMVYDGEMTKHSGTSSEALHWEGELGMLAGSTPSVYSHFEEVADMGERFVCFRMKPYDEEKAVRAALKRKAGGRALDRELASLYGDYVKETVKGLKEEVPEVSDAAHERIVRASMLAARLRTPTHVDRFSKEIDRVPVPEMPMRVALQLSAVARGLMAMRMADSGSWELPEEDLAALEWCAWSLANEERRACLRVLAGAGYGEAIRSQTVADAIGLSTSVTSTSLQHLAAIGVLERRGDAGSLTWKIREEETRQAIRRICGISEDAPAEERDLSLEEGEEMERAASKRMEEF